MTITNVTSKGQVTLPKRVRDAMGLKPGAKVSIEYSDGGAIVRPAPRKHGKIGKSDFMKRIEKVRGTLKLGMSTDEYMKMMRGDD